MHCLNVPLVPMFFWPSFADVTLPQPGMYREKSFSSAYDHLSDPKFRFMTQGIRKLPLGGRCGQEKQSRNKPEDHLWLVALFS